VFVYLIFLSAWQECYDENSGYIYYWNVETNAVTWEMPPEYQAYIASATSMQAQHWMMEQSMGMVPVMPAQHQMGHAAMSKCYLDSHFEQHSSTNTNLYLRTFKYDSG
jgi:hypothetical protein